MKKLVISTIGTSIASFCSVDRDLMKSVLDWDSKADEIKGQLREGLKRSGIDLQNREQRRQISAELNALDRIGISSDDSVVLLASDNAQGRVCSELLKEVIIESFGLKSPQVEVKRIKGMQVYDAETLRREGIINLIDTVAGGYLTNPQIENSYETIINPVGGYKVIVPFLTVLGMLYRKRIVYIFEHSGTLIEIPPLPFSYDLDLYERAKPAIRYIEEETAVPEQAFFAKISGYCHDEKDLFSSFIEPAGNGMVTLSPLTFCLQSGRDKPREVKVTKEIQEYLNTTRNAPVLALKRMLDNSHDPIWRASHIHRWENSELITIKRSNTAERLAGFIKNDGIFYVTHAFTDHDDYERILGNNKVSDFANTEFIFWENDEDLGDPSDESDALRKDRDRLLIENKDLKEKIGDKPDRGKIF